MILMMIDVFVGSVVERSPQEREVVGFIPVLIIPNTLLNMYQMLRCLALSL